MKLFQKSSFIKAILTFFTVSNRPLGPLNVENKDRIKMAPITEEPCLPKATPPPPHHRPHFTFQP